MPYNAEHQGGLRVFDLLLITDVTRFRDIFTRQSVNRDFRLHIANDLEKGLEELAASKPAIVFVQSHLSGLSPEILLRHLKKQLEQQPGAFVLLGTPEQIADDSSKNYHGYLDTTLDDDGLVAALSGMIASLFQNGPPDGAIPPPLSPDTGAEPAAAAQESGSRQAAPAPAADDPADRDEPSLTEQGLTYAPRPRLVVNSAFNSSFDQAVSSTPEPEPLPRPAATGSAGSPPPLPPSLPLPLTSPPRTSRRKTFLLWLVPVTAAVVIVTFLQHREQSPAAVPSAEKPAKPAIRKPETAPLPPLPAATPVPAAAPAPAAASSPTAAPAPEAAPARPRQPVRLKTLPAPVAAARRDPAYTASHPGRERYTAGQTEFKVHREGETIKAVQVVDLGGRGLKEGLLTEIAGMPGAALAGMTTETREGIEIRRGTLPGGITAVIYRNAKGAGTVRAFVLTWE